MKNRTLVLFVIAVVAVNLFLIPTPSADAACISPSSISDLHAWYDASDLSTITKDGADRVSQWDDKSGNGFDLVQAVGGSQPLWLSANRNGLDVIDTTDDRFMAASWPALSQPFTIFMVLYMPEGDLTSDYLWDSNDAANRAALIMDDSGADVWNQFAGIEVKTTQAGLDNQWTYLKARYDTTDSSLDINTTSVHSGVNVGSNTMEGLTMMAINGGGSFGNSRVGEFIIYGKDVPEAEATQIIDYLSGKWAFGFDCNFAPDAVDDLVISGETFNSVDLSWTAPFPSNSSIIGYQINYTTPFGSPLTIIANDTGSTATSYQVSGLAVATDYSFRVSAWWETLNATGNIANTTTLGSAVSAGNFTINGTNPNTTQMLFERQDVNDTHTFVNVTYSDTFDLVCDLSYKFAMTNRTYTNLDNVTLNANFVESSFLFINQTNDIVSIYCQDSITGYDGRYVVQWSEFPLIDQLNNFKNGTYGTQGMLGALDLITVMVIIVSMLGFNRINEAVGVVFSVGLLGALAYFEIIEPITILFGVLAIIIVLGVTTARKD